jgi:hypothetical protein
MVRLMPVHRQTLACQSGQLGRATVQQKLDATIVARRRNFADRNLCEFLTWSGNVEARLSLAIVSKRDSVGSAPFGDQFNLERKYSPPEFGHIDAQEPAFDTLRGFRFELGHVLAVASGVYFALQRVAITVGTALDLNRREGFALRGREVAIDLLAVQRDIDTVAGKRLLPSNPLRRNARLHQLMMDDRVNDIFLATKQGRVSEDGCEQLVGDVHVVRSR